MIYTYSERYIWSVLDPMVTLMDGNGLGKRADKSAFGFLGARETRVVWQFVTVVVL